MSDGKSLLAAVIEYLDHDPHDPDRDEVADAALDGLTLAYLARSASDDPAALRAQVRLDGEVVGELRLVPTEPEGYDVAAIDRGGNEVGGGWGYAHWVVDVLCDLRMRHLEPEGLAEALRDMGRGDPTVELYRVRRRWGEARWDEALQEALREVPEAAASFVSEPSGPSTPPADAAPERELVDPGAQPRSASWPCLRGVFPRGPSYSRRSRRPSAPGSSRRWRWAQMRTPRSG